MRKSKLRLSKIAYELDLFYLLSPEFLKLFKLNSRIKRLYTIKTSTLNFWRLFYSPTTLQKFLYVVLISSLIARQFTLKITSKYGRQRYQPFKPYITSCLIFYPQSNHFNTFFKGYVNFFLSEKKYK